ncbi:histidinol phosphate phosphatase domain-containing protein [Lysinibacillus yapensis]|uniref:Histidinol-phosphatase n=1 Tax=Ureibacillus yapensis TaxID=2304605 RepID=A0A396SB83_9BACL|nr:histidinol phosphate phosphatase domain-containing protein [Lysinibacillus yapensis]RHW36733.1 histidinol phosphate phosphatase domain-containing protein [Lysinibacillus yapensis]
MKVDYHIHLEEGPYSLSLVEKTLKAMAWYEPNEEMHHSKKWLEKSIAIMSKRLAEGEYSQWWLDFYLKEAITKGIKEVGIVDHLYRFKETKDYFTKYMDVESTEVGTKQAKWLDQVMVRSLPDFVEFIQSQKERWASKGVQLKLGMEADYFVGGEAELESLLEGYDFDYIIGSVHFNNGWGFDNPELQHKFQEHDLHALYKDHFETVKKAAESNLFDFIAHLDNMKVFNYRPDEASLIEMYKEVARVLVEQDIATEINPGLYYRYPVKEMCPSAQFLDVLLAEGVKFTMSSDSHFPNDLGIYSNEIKEMLVKRGVTEIATFEKRQRIMKPLVD